MGAFLVRRLTHAVLVVVAALMLVFFIGHVIGDPVGQMLPLEASQELRDDLRESLGFDDPLLVQFGRFVQRALSGFGDSLFLREGALGLVLERVPATLYLAGIAAAIAVPVGLVIGSLAGLYAGSIMDRLTNVFGLAGVSIVDFWLGLMLILVFAITLGWLPTGGYGGGSLNHVILPALTLAYRSIGRLSQIARGAIREEYRRPYVELLRTKGLSERRVFLHVAKNAAIPVVTVGGDEIITLANGAIVVETVFAWPGVGRLLIDSIWWRDLHLVEATVFVVVVIVIVGNLLVDLLYQRLDPKISMVSRSVK